MKIQRFNEDIEFGNEYVDTNLLQKTCKLLFWKLFDDELNISNFTLLLDVKTGFRSPNEELQNYKLFCKLFSPITQDTYKTWNLLFSILENTHFEYSFYEKQLNITISDIELFIDEMKKIIESNKYNL